MILIVAALAALATVPLAGGSLAHLADLRLRGGAIAVGALGLQLLIVTALPQGSRPLHVAAHLLSYGMIALFAWVNRRLPGLALLALGGSLNLLAIAANGGVMPASHWAYRVSGLRIPKGDFANSAPLAHPHLLALGDVLAVPRALPLSNVFSVGDLVIVAGVLALAHCAGASRLSPARAPRAVSVRLISTDAATALLHVVVRDAGTVVGLGTGAGRLEPLPGSAPGPGPRDWQGGFAIRGGVPRALRLDLGWRELDLRPHLL